jgi:hypothetical protein
VFRRFRIAILLYILVFVALGQYLTARRSTDWDEPLWVDVHLVNEARSEAVQDYLDGLDAASFTAVEDFFRRQARSYGVALDQPFRIRVAGQLDSSPPQLPENAGMLGTMLWSLKMRWFVMRLNWSRDGPTPDITVFCLYHDSDSDIVLDRSTALRKGMFAIVNLYASRAQRGSNQMIVAHELLHTLGATDKYDLVTTLPRFPDGFADPEQTPLYPQRRAELMGGRIPLSTRSAEIPVNLQQVVIGPVTALEIGWRHDLRHANMIEIE